MTDSIWYYAVTVPGDCVTRFAVGDSVDVFFNSLSETFPMEVFRVGEVQEDQVVIVLRSSQDDDKAEDLRQESGRVIFYSSEGIRVPKEALRVSKDGERGVYVVVSQKARFGGENPGRGREQLSGEGRPHRRGRHQNPPGRG